MVTEWISVLICALQCLAGVKLPARFSNVLMNVNAAKVNSLTLSLRLGSEAARSLVPLFTLPFLSSTRTDQACNFSKLVIKQKNERCSYEVQFLCI